MGPTILFVDDHPALLRVLSEVLRRAGYRVVEVSNAEAAIGMLMAGAARPDLVISDVDMADGEQHSLIEHVQRHCPALPLLLISGHDAPTAQHRFGIPPDVPFLQKPFSAEVLLDLVKRLSAAGLDATPGG